VGPTALDEARGGEVRRKIEGGARRGDAHRETGSVASQFFLVVNGDLLRRRAWTRGSMWERGRGRSTRRRRL
jgi:hypothetical protein